MVTKKRDNRRPKSRGKNIPRRPERIGYCPEEGFDYKAVGLLKKYISETGKIDSAKRNGLSSKCQRSLTTAVKRARHMALLPFASNHNYDTSLLDIGKRDSASISSENIVSNESEAEEEIVVGTELNSDQAAQVDSVKNEADAEEPITEDTNETEDKEESS